MNIELLDHQFRELFKDSSQVGFKVDDHLYVKMVRKDTLRNSQVEVYKDGTLWFRERLGRFSCYQGFFNAIRLTLTK